MIGIQCYPISLKLEGPEAALSAMKDYLSADAALLCVNEVECPEVFNSLPLPHEARTTYYIPEGDYCFEPDPSRYNEDGLIPVPASDPRLSGFDALGAFVEACRRTGIKGYVWIQTFHLKPEIRQFPEAAMVDLYGHRLECWACPSNPLVVSYNLQLIEDLLTRYDLSGIFIDRFRFPSPYDGLPSFLTCFCDHCRQRAAALRIDYGRCRDHVQAAFDWVSSTSALELSMHEQTGWGGGTSVLQTVLKLPGLFDWLLFRQRVITEYVGQVSTLLRGKFPDRELGLDIWTPTYAWALGQDWKTLEPLADWIKPILYPLPAGPASLAGELVSVLTGCRLINPGLPSESLLRILCRMMGFHFPGADKMEEISSTGFPPAIYELEMKRARSLIRKRKPLFAGCPIIDTGPEGVVPRVKAIAETDAEGIFFYCYDYAPWENLKACGDAWEKLGNTVG